MSKEPPQSGTVKSFNQTKGFGFLISDKRGPDVFVHALTLRSAGIAELFPGQKVLFRAKSGPKGLQANFVEVLG